MSKYETILTQLCPGSQYCVVTMLCSALWCVGGSVNSYNGYCNVIIAIGLQTRTSRVHFIQFALPIVSYEHLVAKEAKLMAAPVANRLIIFRNGN